MAIRKFAAVSIATALVFGTAGCTFMSPLASRIEYSPSDGSQVNLDSLRLRNFVYLTNGTVSALAGSIINAGDSEQAVTIEYTDAALNEKKSVSISVAAGQKLDLGFNGQPALNIDLGGKAGDIVRITVTDGVASPVELRIPVLDNTFDYYQSTIDSLPLKQSEVSGKK